MGQGAAGQFPSEWKGDILPWVRERVQTLGEVDLRAGWSLRPMLLPQIPLRGHSDVCSSRLVEQPLQAEDMCALLPVWNFGKKPLLSVPCRGHI